MELSKSRVLNDHEIEMVHKASLEVLNDVGLIIKSEKARNFLGKKGLDVNHNTAIVKFNPQVVMDAVESTPKDFEIFSLDRSYSFKIGQGHPTRIGIGFDSLFEYNYKDNTRNPFTKRAVGRFAQLGDNLDNVDIVGTQAYPQDVNPKACLLHGVEALFKSTIKPIIFAPEKEIEVDSIIEMIKVVTDSDNIEKQPAGICLMSPSSPLFWNSETVDGFIRITREGFPCLILPGILAGATGPYGIVGALVQKNAEVLSGITIAQLANKGTPLLYRNGGNRLEMRLGANLLGTIESFIFSVAGTQMAEYYDMPSHGVAPNSDSCTMDEQTAIENTQSLMSGFESRTSLIMNIGMFGSAKLSNLEQAVIDNEIVKLARRYVRGVEVNEKTLMVDAIKRVGPQGNYIGDPSTLENLKSDEFTDSEVLNRKDLGVWVKEGCSNIIDRASKEVFLLLDNEVRTVIDDKKSKSIKRIIDKYESEIG